MDSDQLVSFSEVRSERRLFLVFFGIFAALFVASVCFYFTIRSWYEIQDIANDDQESLLLSFSETETKIRQNIEIIALAQKDGLSLEGGKKEAYEKLLEISKRFDDLSSSHRPSNHSEFVQHFIVGADKVGERIRYVTLHQKQYTETRKKLYSVLADAKSAEQDIANAIGFETYSKYYTTALDIAKSEIHKKQKEADALGFYPTQFARLYLYEAICHGLIVILMGVVGWVRFHHILERHIHSTIRIYRKEVHEYETLLVDVRQLIDSIRDNPIRMKCLEATRLESIMNDERMFVDLIRSNPYSFMMYDKYKPHEPQEISWLRHRFKKTQCDIHRIREMSETIKSLMEKV